MTLADGAVLEWDGLVVATGLHPRRLDVPGPAASPGSGRHVLRTQADGRALRRDLHAGARVVVVGTGFVGCEVAVAARMLGCQVTCTAVDPVPMLRPLGAAVGAALQRRHEGLGTSFRLGVGVQELVGEDRVRAVVLTDGSALPADVVVEAVGSRPATGWLAGADLDLTDGVLADNALQAVRTDGTSVGGVVVVGDVARFPNPHFDDVPRRVEHWGMPTDTGRHAGAVLAAWLAGAPAGRAPFTPMPAFWSDQGDLHLQSFGLPELGPQVEVLEGSLEHEAVVGYRRGDGALVGVLGIGMLDHVLARRADIGAPSPPLSPAVILVNRSLPGPRMPGKRRIDQDHARGGAGGGSRARGAGAAELRRRRGGGR